MLCSLDGLPWILLQGLGSGRLPFCPSCIPSLQNPDASALLHVVVVPLHIICCCSRPTSLGPSYEMCPYDACPTSATLPACQVSTRHPLPPLRIHAASIHPMYPYAPLTAQEVELAAACCRARAQALGLPPLRFNTITLQVSCFWHV